MRPTRALFALALLAVVAALGGVAQAETPDAALRAELRALADAGRFTVILNRTQNLLSLDADNVVALEYRGYAHHRLGSHQQAGVQYERLVALQPNHGWGHAQLGAVQLRYGQFDYAVSSLERAVKLDPKQVGAWKNLSLAERGRLKYFEALKVVRRALSAGIDPAWCQLEMGYIEYARHDLARARSAFRRAGQSGASAGDVDHGLDLVDLALDGSRGRKPKAGIAWTFEVAGVRVESSLGPKLPDKMRRLIERAVEHAEKHVAALPRDGLVLRLTRTFEEHEATRRVKFPGSSVGRAFMERRFTRGSGRRGGRDNASAKLVIHAAWPSPTLLRSVSHELVHAALDGRSMVPPMWLDEGFATYLEFDLSGRTPSLGERREDLIATLRAAQVAGSFHADRDLLSWATRSFSGPGARLAYAESWSLVHYLVERRGETRSKALERLTSLMSSRRPGRGPSRGSGGDSFADLARVYGEDADVLLAKWHRHRDALIAR